MSNNSLSGEIQSELSRLSNLVELNLSNNRLSGEIGSSLTGLTNLDELNLSNNLLTGTIPIELENLTNVDLINLSENKLSGEIPPEIGSLRNLDALDVSNNQLTGAIPAELGGLINIVDINLSNNELFGEIPSELGNLINLDGLNLSNNELSGEIPPELSKLKNLDELDLSDNQFTGALPRDFTNLYLLRSLYHRNSGACAPGDDEFQSWVKSLDKYTGEKCPSVSFSRTIDDLKFSINQPIVPVFFPSVSGGVPPIIYKISAELPKGLMFDSSNQALFGSPTESYSKTTFSYIATDAIGSQDSISFTIQIEQNALSVESVFNILREIHKVCANCRNWNFSHTPQDMAYFQGWWNLTFDGGRLVRIGSIDLIDIPSVIGDLITLEQLATRFVNGGGTITLPPEIGNLMNLEVLDIFGNSRLSGTIPPEIGNLVNLEVLGISGTSLSGTIPPEIGNLKKLKVIVIRENNFSGPLPRTLMKIDSLIRIEFHDNKELCAPIELDFQVWLRSVNSRGPNCSKYQNYFESEIGTLTFYQNAQVNPDTLPKFSTGFPPYTYRFTPELPDGLDFDASSRTLTGIPAQITSDTYTYAVTDAIGFRDSLMFNLHILPIPALTFNREFPNQSFPNRQTISTLYLPRVSGNVGAVEYSLSPALPQGLNFLDQRTNPAINGRPSEVTAGPILYTYTATDTRTGSEVTLSFTIEVYSPVHGDQETFPNHFILHSNYPNPFREITRLKFDLPSVANVSVEVFDVLGKRVIFQSPKNLSPGWSREIEINGVNLSSGAYLYRLLINSQNENVIHFGRIVKIQ